MKAEKYLIVTESILTSVTDAGGAVIALPIAKTRYGFGAAGEEVQKLLALGIEKVRVKIDGTPSETIFVNSRPWRLLDIKQRIKGLSADND